MNKGKRTGLVIVAIAIVGGMAIGAAVRAGASSDWACKPEQVAFAIVEHEPEGGASTAAEALRNEANAEAHFGVVTESQLDQALASDSGDTRYDADTGMLYVDGSVVAKFRATQLTDKTWVVGSAQFCTVPPSDEGPSTPIGSSDTRSTRG
jgi:hypothetical protein